jgi:hypothetical protein
MSMVALTIEDGVATFEVEGADKLWALKSRLQIPLAHIRGARIDTEIAHGWWHGLRAPGTSIPGIITAGTFYQHGKRVFWDVHHPERVVVVELADERYDELVIEVEDPAITVATIASAIGAAGRNTAE